MRYLVAKSLFLVALVLSFSSCRYYTRDIIFRMDDERDKQYLSTMVRKAEANYRVAKNDYIEFQLFTSGGETLIDPNAELSRQLAKAGVASAAAAAQGNKAKYLVSDKGDVLLPMVGLIKVDSLTVRQLDSTLEKKYSDFYKNCFVTSRIENRRCFVFASGAGGGGGAAGVFNTPSLGGKVVPLKYEKMNLFEVMAEASSMGIYSKMDRVRIIRGDLQKPEVIVIDLTHVHTMARQDLTILPNDIVYVEPGRRPGLEILRDITQVSSFFIGSIGIGFLLVDGFLRSR